uniref:Alternative protein RNF8 n=1 Tax=Homo sapiens TaxID=9606 RepID=L0R6N6_HUMAN|nr:alternative protein RNF8 [Homo sapiens]
MPLTLSPQRLLPTQRQQVLQLLVYSSRDLCLYKQKHMWSFSLLCTNGKLYAILNLAFFRYMLATVPCQYIVSFLYYSCLFFHCVFAPSFTFLAYF